MAAFDVNVTEHFEASGAEAARGQLPPAAKSLVKVTVPAGLDFVPSDWTSVTVAVQVIAEPIGATTGTHATVVDVARLFTVIVVPPLLP